MVSDTTNVESELIAIKAEEYRDQGYEVRMNVPLDFAPAVKADLLVRKDGQSKVILVRTRTALKRHNAYKELGRLLSNKPGWSFELMMVGEPEKLLSSESSNPMPEEGIVRRLEETQKALDAGLDVGAFLLAWSAAEGVVRSLVAAEGVLIDRVTTPDYLLDMAVHYGAISRDDYNRLFNLMTYRNTLSHGFEVDDFDGSLTADLVETVQRLMLVEPD